MILDNKDSFYKISLADGSSVLFQSSDILINTDGPSKQPIFGKNTFRLYVDKTDGVVPKYFSTGDEATFQSGCLKNGQHCISWILQYGNMDYLKVNPEDGKCLSNGKQLDFENNTSCN